MTEWVWNPFPPRTYSQTTTNNTQSNTLKEQDMTLPAKTSADYFIHKAISYLGSLAVIPEAQIGVTNGQQGKHPWTATVGTTSISHKSSAGNHLRLALEHLVAAQTIPRLVKAWEKSEAELAEHIKAREVECEAAVKAREAENYRFKRREALVKEFTGSPSGAWEYASDLAQTAIDRIITWEINDGATR